MVKLQICCLIVGEPGSVFAVGIDENKLVGHVKEKIKKEKMYQFPADKLQLFLAKKGGAWLKSDDPDVLCIGSGSIPDQADQVGGLLFKDIYEKERVDDLFSGAPTMKTVHVLVKSPTSRLTAATVAMHDYLFMNVPSTTPSGWMKMKRELVEQYECARGKNNKGEEMLRCMVMDIGLPSSCLHVAHLFRRKHDQLKSFVQIPDIDHVRNGLLLFKPIKSAFDDLDIAFLVDEHDHFTLMIFNPMVKDKLLVDKLTDEQEEALGLRSLPRNWKKSTSAVGAPNAPDFNVLTTFGDLEGRTLRFPAGSALRPLRRCLYLQALLAKTKAITQGWWSEDANFCDFSSEGLKLDEKVELLFSGNWNIPEVLEEEFHQDISERSSVRGRILTKPYQLQVAEFFVVFGLSRL